MSGLPFAGVIAAALLWPLWLAMRVPLRGWVTSSSPSRVWLDGWWCTAPLPALALLLPWSEPSLTLSWWLLGGVWSLDDPRRSLLAVAVVMWGLSGLYACGYLASEQHRQNAGDDDAGRRLQYFALFWPLCLAGNLLLIVAEDIASFYLGFATMTFAAYALVVHAGTRDARTGGLAYLVMAVMGEGMILAGLLWAAGSAQTTMLDALREGLVEAEQGVWMAALLWLGFGVKAGVVGLHMWLPLAHPVAPTPASAVLSGVMIKAGLLGWLMTLPLGHAGAGEAFVMLGRVMLVAGLAAAFGAALYGACQPQPKAVLAYSSVSQMGMLTALVAMGLIVPDRWPALLAAVILFACHHGLTKGALFLGVGVSEHPPRLPSWLLWILLVLPGLSLAGVLGSGLASKWAYKTVFYDADHKHLVLWLSLAAVGTTLLMARALWRQWRAERQARHDDLMPLSGAMPVAWLGSLLAAATLPWWLPMGRTAWPPPGELVGLWWPAALGVALAVSIGLAARQRLPGIIETLPPGDLWWPLVRGYRAISAKMVHGLSRLGMSVAAVVRRLQALERWLIDGLGVLARGEQWLGRHSAVLMMASALLLAIIMLAAP
ncbi:complex I subunit 5 family protein [Halomonas korlensis]|uniref:Formate hydrogenlyase subunit 3/Multisubunit Na+/H+ antiporter, MnhD subunit n=1 Tax=Halomonas korlensis TaxID=463301 RepID=A0A1I7G286_9GAMM|nr:complex I subunit 5 family protein [Halomonas korlensis]SFU42537.1 Formate hydrogenlyase subunit 3/Multisubunit Na+/H+ antiporter, MnhD subunit [Halomonas korlensis]